MLAADTYHEQYYIVRRKGTCSNIDSIYTLKSRQQRNKSSFVFPGEQEVSTSYEKTLLL